MQHIMRSVNLALRQVDRRYVRLGLAVLTLALFVLGAGAPGASGGGG